MAETRSIFEKIIAREVPAEIVYEDEHVIAFLDISPVNRGHTLVVPKTRSENIYTIDANSWKQLMEVVRILAPTVKRAVGADGINIMMNNDAAAGQEVPHTHVHIVPRFAEDGFKHWPGTPYGDGAMRDVAEAIRKELA